MKINTTGRRGPKGAKRHDTPEQTTLVTRPPPTRRQRQDSAPQSPGTTHPWKHKIPKTDRPCAKLTGSLPVSTRTYTLSSFRVVPVRLATRGASGSSSSSWAHPLVLAPGTCVLASFYLNKTCFHAQSDSNLNSFLHEVKNLAFL